MDRKEKKTRVVDQEAGVPREFWFGTKKEGE
jgi:hypothetical protein